MSERNDPRGNDRPNAPRKPFSRRRFLQGVGTLSLAALAPKSLLSAGSLAATEKGARAGRPLLGALFNPYHRPEDWSLLGPGSPEGMPLLGAYASHAVGSNMTQIIWARKMGVQFLLAAYSPARASQTAGLDALFEAAGRDAYRVGLYIDLEDSAGRPRQKPSKARLAAALEQVASRYLSQPAYFRNASEQPVLAVAGLDDGNLLDDALAATGGPKVWGPVLRFPAAWRSAPDSQKNPELAHAVDHQGLYLGFSARNGAHGTRRSISSHLQPVSAVLVSPVRDQATGLQLPAITADRACPDYVILDSFNHWGVSVPLEPGTRSGTRYGEQIARWSRSYRA